MRLLGKTGIEVFEYPGYVTTRVILPFLNEAMHVVMEGVATAEAVDTSMRLGYGMPVGPLALADRMGLDEVMRWMQHLFDELGDVKYRPCPLLRKMVRAGKLGVKSGSGLLRVRRGRGAGRDSGSPLEERLEAGRCPSIPSGCAGSSRRSTDEDLDAYVEVTRRILAHAAAAERARGSRRGDAGARPAAARAAGAGPALTAEETPRPRGTWPPSRRCRGGRPGPTRIPAARASGPAR